MTVKLPVSGEVLEEPLTDRLRAMIGAHLENPTSTPVAPRYAATVMLVRKATASPGPVDGNQLEVFMLRRASTMAFAPDAVVFPGGRVDDADADRDLPWAGPSPSDWAERMNCDEATARRIVVAAAREVFEETGILLAGEDTSSLVSDLKQEFWAEERTRLNRREVCFAAMLRSRGLVLRSDLMGLRSNWLTPEFEPRRYDTFFFAALVPPGQNPDAETTEAVEGIWAIPEQLIADAAANKVLLLPPTAYNLAFLANANSADEFVLENPTLHKIMVSPKVKDDGQTVLTVVLP